MGRKDRRKGKAQGVSASPKDQPDTDSGETASPNGVHPPTTDLIKPALETGEIRTNRASLLPPVKSTGQDRHTNSVSATVSNSTPASFQKLQVASANSFEVLETLSDRPVKNWADEATAASEPPVQAAQSSKETINAQVQSAPTDAEIGQQPRELTPSEIRELRKTQGVLFVGERGLFKWHVPQGLLLKITTKYRAGLSDTFPSGLTVEFPQTPRSVLKYVEQFIRNGGVDALYSGAAVYPGADVRALVHLQSVAHELGISELEARTSRDIALVQGFLKRHTSWAIANEKRASITANPELFIVMAEYENKLYKVHCKKREMEKRGRQSTRGTLRCVGVVRHFVEYAFPHGPFELIARDHDGFWTVACSAAALRVDFIRKKDQEIISHLDLVQLRD